jgi:hypothetical protein
VHRLAGDLVLEVALQHGRQRAVAPEPRLQGGQGPALPGGARLRGGRPGLDHPQQPVDLVAGDAGLLQALPGGGQQPPDQLGDGQRADPPAGVERPRQRGAEAELGGAVEVVMRLLERQPAGPGAGVGGERQRETEWNAALASMSTTVGPAGSARSSIRRCPPAVGS